MIKNQQLSFALKAIGLAMGVAVVVLSLLSAASVQTIAVLEGIGLLAVAMAVLSERGR